MQYLIMYMDTSYGYICYIRGYGEFLGSTVAWSLDPGFPLPPANIII